MNNYDHIKNFLEKYTFKKFKLYIYENQIQNFNNQSFDRTQFSNFTNSFTNDIRILVEVVKKSKENSNTKKKDLKMIQKFVKSTFTIYEISNRNIQSRLTIPVRPHAMSMENILNNTEIEITTTEPFSYGFGVQYPQIVDLTDSFVISSNEIYICLQETQSILEEIILSLI